MSLCIAAGPFTTAEDTGYAPLAELLAACAARRPDVLLLLGPFVDVEHPAIASGALDVPFEALFQAQVLGGSRGRLVCPVFSVGKQTSSERYRAEHPRAWQMHILIQMCHALLLSGCIPGGCCCGRWVAGRACQLGAAVRISRVHDLLQ